MMGLGCRPLFEAARILRWPNRNPQRGWSPVPRQAAFQSRVGALPMPPAGGTARTGAKVASILWCLRWWRWRAR